ncbi:MAG: hypothetical protein U9R57_07705 [Thermodesulfobacteriota bacterium]|nr:hypothetical protein [Thermodesulfobacteriota bacterium]
MPHLQAAPKDLKQGVEAYQKNKKGKNNQKRHGQAAWMKCSVVEAICLFFVSGLLPGSDCLGFVISSENTRDNEQHAVEMIHANTFF